VRGLRESGLGCILETVAFRQGAIGPAGCRRYLGQFRRYTPAMSALWLNLPILLFLLILAVVSGLFSGSETILFSLSRHDRSRMKKSKNRLEVLAASLVDRPRSLLTTLMLGNMTCNILIFVISSMLLASPESHETMSWTSRILLAVLTLVPPLVVTYVSDVFPKVVGTMNNTRLAPVIAIPVATLVRVFWPLSRAIEVAVLRPVHRVISGGHEGKHAAAFTEEELTELLEMSQQQGVIDVSESELLQEVVRLGDMRIRDVMTPRVDVVAFNIKDRADKLVALFRQTHLTKLPVYEGEVESVLGLVYAKEVLLEDDPRKIDVRKFIRPVGFVPEFITCDRALSRFRQTRTQFAVVVDEFGGIVGVATVEDIVEQMVGDIMEPNDAPAATVQKIGPQAYRVPGDLSVVDWMEAFGAPVNAEGKRMDLSHASTLAGLLATVLQRIPKVGDQIHFGHLRMTVESMRGRRVERVLLELKNPAAAGEPDAAVAGGVA